MVDYDGQEIGELREALEEISADIKPELCSSELELIVWWGRQVDRLQAIARNALSRAQCALPRDELADAFAKKFPAALAQYSQYKIIDWVLGAFTATGVEAPAQQQLKPSEALKLADEMQSLGYMEFGDCLSLKAYNLILAALRAGEPAQQAPDRMAIALALINETRTFHGLDAIGWDFPALSTSNKTRALRQADAIIATLSSTNDQAVENKSGGE